MKLVFLIGNCAVGKMTVGQELCKITPLKLFHNHTMIEPVMEILGYYDLNTTMQLRDVIFRAFSHSDNYGMIFTYMWAFDHPEDWEYVEHIKSIFSLPEKDVYYIELLAPQDVRLQRNISANRLVHKASKRNLDASIQRLIQDDLNYRCESFPGEIPFPNYFRLENTNLSPQEAAQCIKEHFAFTDI